MTTPGPFWGSVAAVLLGCLFILGLGLWNEWDLRRWEREQRRRNRRWSHGDASRKVGRW